MWMSHVTHLFPSMAASLCRCSSSLTPPWLISSSHVTHVNESWHAYEWVISHICTNQVCVAAARIEHIRRKYEGFVSHMWMSHVTHTNESCHKYVPIECASLRLEFHLRRIYEGVTAHFPAWISWAGRRAELFSRHVVHVNGTCCTNEGVKWVMSHIWRSHFIWGGYG